MRGASRWGLQGRAPPGNPRVLGECRWAQKVDVLAEMFLLGLRAEVFQHCQGGKTLRAAME